MTHFFGVDYATRQYIARVLGLGIDAVPEIDLMHIIHVLTMTTLGVLIGIAVAKNKII